MKEIIFYLDSLMNRCNIPLSSIRQTLLLNQDCSCGIAAILESRRCSQITSTGTLVKVRGKFVKKVLHLFSYLLVIYTRANIVIILSR